MDGLAAVRLAPNVRGGNFAGHVFEQIDSGLVKVRDNLGRLIGFLFCVRPGDQVWWNDQAQRFRADTRAIGNDEVAKRKQRFIFLPHGDVQEGVGANNKKKPIAMVNVAEIAHGVHGIVELRAAEVLAGFGKRGNKMRMLSACERDHRKAVRERREVLLQLVRRPARGNEVKLVEIEPPVGSSRNGKMAVVDGVEGTAEERDLPRMMFGGGAVRLRGGQ